ncbi:MAG TPA: TRAP transporter substrate-binding protein DctP [Stellaceae bacterium]|nr:TRAP transporter substrate-binding protein DctP [Stellaceae bacterium]
MPRVIALALLTAIFSVQPAQAQVLKLATLAPDGSPWHDVIIDIGESWKAASGGRITLRVYPGGVAGDDPDMIRKMRIGQLQAAVLTGTGLAQITPEIQALQMPMMLSSYDELDYVRDRMAPKLEALTEAHGFKILSWGDAGWVRCFSPQPVIRPADLKPLKLFTWEGDPAYAEVIKRMGFQPVPLAVTDIYTGLQSGLISAVPTTPIAALSFQWFGLANHMADFKWAPLLGGMVITTTAWRNLPDDLKPTLARAARDAGTRAHSKIRPLEDEAIATMKSHGLVVHPVPLDALKEWQATGRGSYPYLIGKVVPAAMVAEVERLRDEYRAQKASQ